MTLLNDKVNKPVLGECVRMRSVASVNFPLNIIHMKLKFPSSCCLKHTKRAFISLNLPLIASQRVVFSCLTGI